LSNSVVLPILNACPVILGVIAAGELGIIHLEVDLQGGNWIGDTILAVVD
jgi:hypothetical protein